jgi:hypothetical protein
MDYFKKAKSQARMAIKDAQGLGQYFQTPYQQPPAWNQNSATYNHQQPQVHGQPHYYHVAANQYTTGSHYAPQPAHEYDYHHAPPVQQPQWAPPAQRPQYPTPVQQSQCAPQLAALFDMSSMYQALLVGQQPSVPSDQPRHSSPLPPPTVPNASRPVEHLSRQIQESIPEQIPQSPPKPRSTRCPGHEPAP